MTKMRQPIDVPGFTLEVIYPSSLYSLERHEIVPYERFAADVFRDCVQELTERRLPPRVVVSFSPIKVDYPAWVINCKVRSETTPGTRFIIECPEMLPCMLVLFSHIISPHFRGTEPKDRTLDLRSSVQRFFDCGSAAVRAFKAGGLASAIRTAYEVAHLDMNTIQDCIDDFDILAYLVANHEVAHIYIEQLTDKSTYPPEDRKAFEYLADLVAAEWMFRRYIFFTPDDAHYREHRNFPSHAHALSANAMWAMAGVFNLFVLMATARAQRSGGRVNLDGGLSHPGAFGRFWLQQAWVLGAIEGHLTEDIGGELMPSILGFWREASDKVYQSGLITRASTWQVVDEQEMITISRAAQIAEDKKIEELMPGLDFLRSRIANAQTMRSRMNTE